jgi:hypothetical protein
MDILEQALTDMLETRTGEGRIELKSLPAAFFDYFEVTEAEKAA